MPTDQSDGSRFDDGPRSTYPDETTWPLRPDEPTPEFVAAMLADMVRDPLQHQHLVQVRQGEMTVRHPLAERAASDLFECQILERLMRTPWPEADGIYRVLEHRQVRGLTLVKVD